MSDARKIHIPGLTIPPAQSKAQEKFIRIGKFLMNNHPDLVIKQVQMEHKREELKPVKLTAPVISLKGLIDIQKQAFEERFKETEKETPVDVNPFVEKTDINPLHIPAPEMEFDQSQEDARKGILSERYSCLIGKAGTGKTKTLQDLLNDLRGELGMVDFKERQKDGTILNVRKLSIVFCSFMGRAVEQMKLKLPAEYHNVCGTIHGDKVLAFQPEWYDDFDEEGNPKEKMRFVPMYNEYNKLPYDVYVIDETGMLAVELFNMLFAAMLPHAKIILVGDINQIPPVYGRSILGYAMAKWPTFELTTIHRQAANNPIIANAHRVLDGAPPMPVKGKFDMDDLKDAGSNSTQDRMIAILRYLHRKGDFNPMTDTAIVPHNVGALGKDQLNELILPFFNPHNPQHPRTLIRTGISTVHFAINDKIMMLTNDKSNGLTNGQIGRVVNISLNGKYKNIAGMVAQSDLEKNKKVHISEDTEFNLEVEDMDRTYSTEGVKKENELSQRQSSHIVTADFGSSTTPYEVTFSNAGQFRAITHAYVITCHKSQGGEYPTVVILVHSANNVSLSREWIYTAITRARNRVVLVFNQRGLSQCLNRQRIKGNTLQEKIQSFIKISEEDSKNENAIIPMLPDARKMKL